MEASTDLKTGKLSTGEYVAMAGAVLMAVAVFLPWYGVDNPLGIFTGIQGRGTYSGWDAHGIVRFLLLLAAISPFVLAWIVVRDHALSWPRGELTMVISLTAVVLILYVGIIERPGEPPGAISLQWGWFLALLGSLLMFGGSVARQTETDRPRKPPGVL